MPVTVEQLYCRKVYDQSKREDLLAFCFVISFHVVSFPLPHLFDLNLMTSGFLLQFSCLVDLLQEMLEHVSRNQRNKLKLERLSMGSIDTTG